MAYQKGLVPRAGQAVKEAWSGVWDELVGYDLPELNKARTRPRMVASGRVKQPSPEAIALRDRLLANVGRPGMPATTPVDQLGVNAPVQMPPVEAVSPAAVPSAVATPTLPQRGFRVNIDDAYSKLGDVAAGGGRTVAPQAERGMFLKGYRYGGPEGVSSISEAQFRSGEGMKADAGATSVTPGRAGAFAERTMPDGGAYVVGSEADPMRRLEMQREAYQTANRGRFQDIAADMRTGGAKPIESAAQLSDKREFDKRKALIETMVDGPEKKDALAALQDEQAASAKLSPFDRFAGSAGSPDAKAREGRIAAYEQNLAQLREGRLIGKREEKRLAKENREIEMKQQELDTERMKAEANMKLAEASGDRDVAQRAVADLRNYEINAKAADSAQNAVDGLKDDWGKEFIKIRNGLIASRPVDKRKDPQEMKYKEALAGMTADQSKMFMRLYTAMSEIGDKDEAMKRSLQMVGINMPKA